MKLADYLTQNQIRPSAFAATLGVPPSTVMRWANGSRLPRLDAMAAIVNATGGVVTAADFLDDKTGSDEPTVEGAAA